jgi:hypothetical protein
MEEAGDVSERPNVSGIRKLMGETMLAEIKMMVMMKKKMKKKQR